MRSLTRSSRRKNGYWVTVTGMPTEHRNHSLLAQLTESFSMSVTWNLKSTHQTSEEVLLIFVRPSFHGFTWFSTDDMFAEWTQNGVTLLEPDHENNKKRSVGRKGQLSSSGYQSDRIARGHLRILLSNCLP